MLANNINSINKSTINGELLEKLIINNDLSSLSALEKVQYVTGICSTIGLNPVTKPIQLIKFQGREIPYFTKDATEQIRKINKVSITNIDTKIIDGIYIVTAQALSEGRNDSSTGVVNISGLKGEALANAMMKAETKAKRRVTLSICGLGFLDESELDTMPQAQRLEINNEKVNKIEELKNDNLIDFSSDLFEIENAKDIVSLQKLFTECYKIYKSNTDILDKFVKAKDIRKAELLEKDLYEKVESLEKEINNE